MQKLFEVKNWFELACRALIATAQGIALGRIKRIFAACRVARMGHNHKQIYFNKSLSGSHTILRCIIEKSTKGSSNIGWLL
jgi:hypothetical protein